MGKEIERLEQLGFSNYEAKVFLALYQGSVMSAADIAKEARIPRPSVYQILRSFAEKGFCNEVTTPKKQLFEIIDSKVIQDKLEIEFKTDFQQKLTSLKACFNEIGPLYKTRQPDEYRTDVELIKGFNLHREQKFLELVKSSNKGILVMNRFVGNVSGKLDKESRDLHKRGGYIRSIYENSTNFKLKIDDKWQNVSKEDLIRLCEDFVKHGEDIRFLNEIPQILAVFDEKIVYISLYDEKVLPRDSSDVVIKNKRFASFITGLFNIYWDRADTLEALKKELE
ncbi:MAG TPA: helix-turn-helix domain-containing protein [Ignavibacteria bacterium]|nr:helix-turn-helix domain-containing protein [Ignavibacteria bacterium]HMQ98185.1 helix-turn-helix domain-containing protein [Ignavibacteria bacterium]